MRTPFTSLQDFYRSKIYDRDSLSKHLQAVRALYENEKTKPTIATLNGSFDLLHSGHLYMLFEASKTADILVVALNTDASIKRYKHHSRPIITLQNRLEMMASLSFVDYVTWFDEDDPRKLLEIIRPDVHVNGVEYGTECIEAPTVREIGARLHLVNRIPGLATSEIIKKVQSLP